MKITRILLYSILYILVSGCVKAPDSDTETKKPVDSIRELNTISASQSERTAQLIQTILHLPEVVKRSAFDRMSKKYGNIYIVLPKENLLDTATIIKLKGRQLTLLKNYKDLADDQPGYVFTRLEVHQDYAIIQLVFDKTGMIVYGRVNYKNKTWTPDENFVVAFQ